MKMSMKLSTAALCLALAACNQTTAHVAQSPAMTDQQAFAASRVALLASLKDPDSAKITNVHRVGEYVCGEVNSKNGFGGYAGKSKFSVASNGRVAMADGTAGSMNGEFFSPCWNELP